MINKNLREAWLGITASRKVVAAYWCLALDCVRCSAKGEPSEHGDDEGTVL